MQYNFVCLLTCARLLNHKSFTSVHHHPHVHATTHKRSCCSCCCCYIKNIILILWLWYDLDWIFRPIIKTIHSKRGKCRSIRNVIKLERHSTQFFYHHFYYLLVRSTLFCYCWSCRNDNTVTHHDVKLYYVYSPDSVARDCYTCFWSCEPYMAISSIFPRI